MKITRELEGPDFENKLIAAKLKKTPTANIANETYVNSPSEDVVLKLEELNNMIN